MSAYAIMRMEKIKSVAQGTVRLKHSRREIECPTAMPGQHNKLLANSPHMHEYKKKSFKEIFRERLKDQKIRKNAVHAVEVVLTFSPGAISDEQIPAWVWANMRWLEKTFGDPKNIIDARLHLDETTPHIHAFVLPIDERGKLNARAFLGGTNNRMSELQTSYAKAMQSFNLERGISKKITKAQHQSSLRWQAEQDKKEVRLKTYEKVFGTEPEWDFAKFVEFQTTQSDIEHNAENQEARKESNISRNVPER